MAPCPTPRALEAYAREPDPGGEVGAHIAGCEACRAAVSEILAVNQFLTSIRPALEAVRTTVPGGPALAADAPVAPDLISGYEIQGEIHRGGQGVIYRAVHIQTRRTVAIKMLLAGALASERQRERFEREARIAAGLRHPNIVTVYDSGYIPDGRYGLAMEFIEGVPLDKWSRALDSGRSKEARRAALRRRLEMMVKVCDAVLYAHQHAIIHRDLKPANILVDSSDEPHILDFGIARSTGPEEHTRLTYTGEFAGTLAYASPEQVSGDPLRGDTRTDIYSLGVIMYEVVSGRMPYPVNGPMTEVMRNIESFEPPPPSRLTRAPDGPWVDGEVSTIILKALAKDPARRYSTAAGLRNDIVRYLAGEAIEARRDSTWYIIRKTAARHRVGFAIAAVAFLLLATFAVVMSWQAYRLTIRETELEAALSVGDIERAKHLAESGYISDAQDVIWPKLIAAGTQGIDGGDAGFTGSPEAVQAYWALWFIYSRSPCISRTTTDGCPVEVLYFDGDGRRLSAITRRGTHQTWSFPSLEPLESQVLFQSKDNGVREMALRSDLGAAAVLGDGQARVFDLQTGDVIAQRDDADGLLATGAFSGDGTLLATIGRDNRLRVWDARSLECVRTIADEVPCWIPGQMECVPTFSPDGRLIAAAKSDGSVGLWDPESGGLTRTLQPPTSLSPYIKIGMRPARIAFSPAGGTIAAAISMHIVEWPDRGEAAPRDMVVGGFSIRSLQALGTDGALLVFASADTLGFMDYSRLSRSTTFAQYRSTPITSAASPDGRWLAAGFADGSVRIFEMETDAHVRTLNAGTGFGTVAALSHDGRLVAFAAGPGGEAGQDILLIDLATGATVRALHGHRAQVVGLDFAPDDASLFVSEERDCTVQWDVARGVPLRMFTSGSEAKAASNFGVAEPAEPADRGGRVMSVINGVRLSPDGRLLARGGADGAVGLWDAVSGAWLGRLTHNQSAVLTVAFGPDGRSLGSLSEDGVCVIWDMERREVRRTIPTGVPQGRLLLLSSDGGTIFTAGPGGAIRTWDGRTGQRVRDMELGAQAGAGTVIHPGGIIMATAGADRKIRLWDTRIGHSLIALRRHESTVVSLQLTPDGHTLISSDLSGTLLAWDLTHYNENIRRELALRVPQDAGP